LVAEVENGEVFGDDETLVVGVFEDSLLAHDVGERSDDGVLQEINRENVED